MTPYTSERHHSENNVRIYPSEKHKFDNTVTPYPSERHHCGNNVKQYSLGRHNFDYNTRPHHFENTMRQYPSERHNYNDNPISFDYNRPQNVTVGRENHPPRFMYESPRQDHASLHLIKQELLRRPSNPFKGDPNEFLVWFPSMQNMLRGIQLSSFDQLLILAAHTDGEPLKIVKEKIAIGGANPDYALKECWEHLIHNYGSGNQIAEALINKIDMTPQIKSVHQTDKLRDLLSLCRMIHGNMNLAKELQFFNMTLGIKMIFCKLPDPLQDGWRETELMHQQNHRTSAPLEVFIQFLDRKL